MEPEDGFGNLGLTVQGLAWGCDRCVEPKEEVLGPPICSWLARSSGNNLALQLVSEGGGTLNPSPGESDAISR